MELKPDTGTLLYRTQGDTIVIYEQFREYAYATGTTPCSGPDERFLSLSKIDQNKYVHDKCNLSLYSYSKSDVKKIQIDKIDIQEELGCEGEKKPKIIAKIKSVNNVMYVSSIIPSKGKGMFIGKEGLKKNNKKLDILKFSLPPNSKNGKIEEIFYVPNESESIVKITSTIHVKGDPEKNPVGDLAWVGIFLYKDGKSELLTPLDSYNISYYNELKDLIGLYYFSESNGFHVLIGDKDKINLVVVKSNGKWEDYSFPFRPPGGC
ncbi:MAG: hypothetical protein AABY53_08835 [Bdellovibrionota bacterium]